MPVRRQLRGRQRHAACAALFFHSIEVRIRRIHTDRYAPDPPLYPCAAEKRRSTGYGRRHPNRAYREYHITKPSQRCEADIAVKLNDIYFGEQGLFVVTEPVPLIGKLEGLKIRPKTPAITTPGVPVNLVAAAPSVGATELPPLDQNSVVDQTYIGRLR